MTYENVSLTTTANVYFDGKCISHSFELADGTKKSAGVIFPGTYTFSTGAPEVMDIQAGSCTVAGETYTAGTQFSVEGNSSFDIEVTELLDYICHYG